MTTQPEALRLAEELDDGYPLTGDAISAAAELRTQHARITELESQLAQRFDAADMATASAQGFRDGAAKEQQAGWVMVPREPTQEMLNAVVTTMDDFLLGKAAEQQYRDDWAAMLAAAPAQPAAQQGVAYAALPTSNYAGRVYEEGFLIGTCPLYTADQMRAFADATYALRAAHGQAPAPAESVTAPGGGVVAAGRFMDEAAERRSAQEGYENRIKRASERNPHDEGMYSLGWWDRAWKAAAPTPPAQAADSVLEDAAPGIDAAFEAVRRGLCKIPRYSFALDSRGNLRRCEDKSGNWIEFDAAHALFDPVAIDAARKQGESND